MISGTAYKPAAFILLLCFVLTGAVMLYLQISRTPEAIIEQQAQEYVVLALAIDQIFPGEVDAWFGPSALMEDAKDRELTLEEIVTQARELAGAVSSVTATETDSRRNQLLDRINQLIAVAQSLSAETPQPFESELASLYGLALPATATSGDLLDKLEALLPGRGNLAFKVASWQNKLMIPAEKRQAVFEAALAECRKRTLSHWDLPTEEKLDIEWTRDVQAAWHEYKGAYRSLLRINALTVAFVSQSVDLACHEGYPGHHAQFVLMESSSALPVEATAVLLRSPGSVLREGAASHAAALVFTAEERLDFERNVLYPLAGLPDQEAATALQIHQLVNDLSSAAAPIIRDYRNGITDFNATTFQLEREAMISSPVPLLEFIDKYGAYAMGYVLVRDLVSEYLTGIPDDKWTAMRELLVTSPDLALERIR